MSLLTTLRDALSAVESFFSHQVWDFLKPFVESVEQNGGAILIAAAQEAVQVGFTANGSGTERMAAALAAFSSEVAAKGLPFIESQARALIEVALQQAKAAVAAPVAAAPEVAGGVAG